MILGLLKFLEHELPSGCPNILHQIRIAFNLGIYQELSVLTCSFSTICIIHLYFITCSSKKCHCMDKVVELSIPFESNKFVASSLEFDRGTHLFKIASQRFSAQNVVLCCMVFLSTLFLCPFFSFFRQWKAGISRG